MTLKDFKLSGSPLVQGSVGDKWINLKGVKFFYPKLNNKEKVVDFKSKEVKYNEKTGTPQERYSTIIAVPKGKAYMDFLYYVVNILQASGMGMAKIEKALGKQMKDGDARKQDQDSGEFLDEFKLDGAQGYVYFNAYSYKDISCFQEGKIVHQEDLLCGFGAEGSVRLNIKKFSNSIFDSFAIYVGAVNITHEGEVQGSTPLDEAGMEFLGIDVTGDGGENEDTQTGFLETGPSEPEVTIPGLGASTGDEVATYSEEEEVVEEGTSSTVAKAKTRTTTASSKSSKTKVEAAKTRAKAKAKTKSATTTKTKKTTAPVTETTVGDQSAFLFG